MEITFAKGGAAEKQVPLDDIQVPDMWHLAMTLKADPTFKPEAAEQVLEVWHLAIDLLRALREPQHSGPALGCPACAASVAKADREAIEHDTDRMMDSAGQEED